MLEELKNLRWTCHQEIRTPMYASLALSILLIEWYKPSLKTNKGINLFLVVYIFVRPKLTHWILHPQQSAITFAQGCTCICHYFFSMSPWFSSCGYRLLSYSWFQGDKAGCDAVMWGKGFPFDQVWQRGRAGHYWTTGWGLCKHNQVDNIWLYEWADCRSAITRTPKKALKSTWTHFVMSCAVACL